MTVELLSRTADDDVIIRLFRVQNIMRVGGSVYLCLLLHVFIFFAFLCFIIE